MTTGAVETLGPAETPKPLPSQNDGGQCAPEEPRLHRESRCGLLPISRINDTVLNATKRVTVCGIFTQQENPHVHMDFEGPWEDQSNVLI